MMETRLLIEINGEAYPCYPTAGAMLRFKQATGREATEMQPGLSDWITYLWCAVASASRREKKPFDMELQDFADSISIDDLTKWQQAVAGDESGDKDEKKSR